MHFFRPNSEMSTTISENGRFGGIHDQRGITTLMGVRFAVLVRPSALFLGVARLDNVFTALRADFDSIIHNVADHICGASS
jgi:hypothetical protein